MVNAIGLIEFSSVAAGIMVSDVMLKAATSELLLSRTICSGKYIVLIAGEVGDVESSVQAGIGAADVFLISHFVIPNVHPTLIRSIKGMTEVEHPDALGILESFTTASLIEGADAALKAAAVECVEVRIAMALGGKSFVTLTGTVGDVEAAITAGAALIASRGDLVYSVVIPRPRPEVFREMI